MNSKDEKTFPLEKYQSKPLEGAVERNDSRGEIALRVVEIVGEIATNLVQAHVKKQEWEARREALILELQRIDVDAAAFCIKVAGRMEPEKERTMRLQLFLDYLTKDGKGLPEGLALQLIEKFSSCDFRE